MGLVSRQPTLPWLFLKFMSQKTREEHKKNGTGRPLLTIRTHAFHFTSPGQAAF